MDRSRVVGLGVVIASLAVSSCAKQDPEGPIFRYTKITGDSITLGSTWPGAARVGIAASDTVAVIPMEYIGGTDGISVHRDSGGVVTQLDFAYGVQRDVEGIVHDYEKLLGKPATITRDSVPGVSRRSWLWQDQETDFKLVQLTPAQHGIAAMAFLVDRRGSTR